MSRVLIEVEGPEALEILERVVLLESSLEELKEMVEEIKDIVSKKSTA